MAYITFYGGVNEIGGNKILLKDKGEEILLDFGKNYEKWSGCYIYPYEKPRSIGELLGLKLIPNPSHDLENLYTSYTFSRKLEWSMDMEKEPKVRACFYSHVHGDHIGCMFLLNRKIEMYMGRATRLIQKAYEDHSKGEPFEGNLTGFEDGKNIFTFKSGQCLNIDPFEVIPLAVDHSVPGSYAFIVQSSNRTIVYTGDIRWHGPCKELTDEFVQKVDEFKPIDYLICDGTCLSKGARKSRYKSEEDVERSIIKLLKTRRKGLVIANVSSIDIDRINTFFKAALNAQVEREFIVTMKIASTLGRLSNLPIKNMPNLSEIQVFSEGEHKSTWEKGFLDGIQHKVKDVSRYEKHQDKAEVYSIEYDSGLQFKRVITAEEIKENPGRYMLVTAFYSINEMRALFEALGYRGFEEEGDYILGTSEPYSEEHEVDFKVLKNWIEKLNLRYRYRHCSGHAGIYELKEIVEKLRPKFIIPIHTDSPENFRLIRKKGIIHAEYGKPLSIS